ncbi:MAG: response regulator [Lachnospiraceae bacterium]|nr:response regulator [Lachnospiraceae bacterium]
MHKIILWDNDGENIKNISKYINSNNNKFKVIGTSMDLDPDYTGIINKKKPDLIIADIKFFGIHSGRILSDIHNKFPEIRFILYGGLNEAEYLKKYLSYGAIDYMIKPFKPSELERCLERASDYFGNTLKKIEEAKKLTRSFENNAAVFEGLFLNNLVNGIISGREEIEENFRYFNMNMTKDFTVLQIKIDNFLDINKGMLPENKHMMIYNMLDTVTSSLIEYNAKSFISSFNIVTVILSGTEGIENIYRIAESIKNNILHKNDIKVTIGIGRTYEAPEDIYLSFNESAICINHRYSLGSNSVIPIDFIQANRKITFNCSYIKEQKLAFNAASGLFDNCVRLLDDIFSYLRKAEPLPERLFSQMVVEIMLSIGRCVLEQRHMSDTKVPEFFSTQLALEIKTLDGAYEYLYENIKRFCAYVNAQRIKEDERIFKEAKEYVEKRYYETISIFKTALFVQTTPDHLNRLFLEYEKDSFYEFAVRTRLEEGKRLLRETDFDDNIIAVNIGYDNGRYFKAIFKQYEKIDPLEYRAKYKEL